MLAFYYQLRIVVTGIVFDLVPGFRPCLWGGIMQTGVYVGEV